MSFLNAVRSFIVVFNYFCMTFTIVLNLVYIVQLFVSFFRVRKDYDRHFSDDYLRYEDSENLMPISLIIPAYNEQENIVQNVRSLMKLNYPSFEIVVINDGSTDRTAELMVNSFHMSPIETSIRSQIPTRHIRKVYYSRKYPNLLFVDKDNGGKSDALNAGINISSYPLFTCLDADSRIEKDALLKLSLEFLKDSRTVVSGGLVRIANGSRIVNGELKGFTMPKKLVERFQIVEYYRSFLMGRVFWGATNSLLIVSGAFGLFRKQTVIDVGGYKTNTIGEDMEIVVRIHRYMRKNRKKYRISFNELAVCWTQGPMSIRDIRSQRRRWQIGLMDTLISHRGMTLNPRYLLPCPVLADHGRAEYVFLRDVLPAGGAAGRDPLRGQLGAGAVYPPRGDDSAAEHRDLGVCDPRKLRLPPDDLRFPRGGHHQIPQAPQELGQDQAQGV